VLDKLGFGIILTPDNRSKAYIQKLLSSHIFPDVIVFMNNNIPEKTYSDEIIEISRKNGFDISKSVKNVLNENNFTYTEFDFVDINHPELINFIKKNREEYYIFTGGGILKNEILNLDVKFVHLHPGLVPKYRGSTCFYYSIVNEGSAGVTAFIMDKGLDTGDIVYQKIFEKPRHKFLDEIYDPYIRSETLVDVISQNLLNKQNFKKQNSREGETYFIIHPVLKHIAILSCITND
tara:strand:- start:1421 stop:2125 length:705 start_codon:yes stop_codon:yes gene_type:complete